jgi:phage N-6-adenine-methyltransferase
MTTYHEVAASTGSPGSYPHGTTEWPTPQWLVDQLAEEFAPGGFDLDPAATAENAKSTRFFTAAVDGLSQAWKARTVWCNPPYGKLSTPAWLAKARHEVDSGNAALVVCLVRVSAGSAWWREAEADPRVFVRVIGRIRWRVDARGEAPFDSAIIVFGAKGRHGTQPSTCANPECPRPYRRFWPAQRNRKTCSDRCRQALYRSQAGG